MKNLLQKSLILIALALPSTSCAMEQNGWFSKIKLASFSLFKRTLPSVKKIDPQIIKEHKKEIAIGAAATTLGILGYYAHWYYVSKPRYQSELNRLQTQYNSYLIQRDIAVQIVDDLENVIKNAHRTTNWPDHDNPTDLEYQSLRRMRIGEWQKRHNYLKDLEEATTHVDAFQKLLIAESTKINACKKKLGIK